LVGFKPTMQRVPTTGALPLAPVLDSIGPIARSVADCLLVDSLIADQTLTPEAVSLSGLKFAVPEDLVMDDIDDTVARAFTVTLSKLSAAGASIVEVPMKMFAEARDINRFPQIESWRWHHKLLATHADQYDSLVATRIRAGEKYTEQDFQRLLAARKDWIARVEQALNGFDAMLMPTVPIVAPRTEALLASEETFFDVNRLLLRNPSLINLLDGCSLSLPCQRTGDLPVGLMIGAPAMADARVFSIGLAIEQILAD
jgi:aspartyl-tRNA(Asn)/glutamyl-tRNA(Gln) amidotransferase subunit A